MSRSGAAGHLIDHHPATAIDRNWTALAVQRLEGVIDRMLGVPDGASVATMRFLSHRLGIAAGPSTGTNVFGALRLACEMCTDQAVGSIVTLMCDSGARYTTTYDDDTWLAEQGIDIGPYLPVVERAWDEHVWDCP